MISEWPTYVTVYDTCNHEKIKKHMHIQAMCRCRILQGVQVQSNRQRRSPICPSEICHLTDVSLAAWRCSNTKCWLGSYVISAWGPYKYCLGSLQPCEFSSWSRPLAPSPTIPLDPHMQLIKQSQLFIKQYLAFGCLFVNALALYFIVD